MILAGVLPVSPSARPPVLHAQDSATVIKAGRLFDSAKGRSSSPISRSWSGAEHRRGRRRGEGAGRRPGWTLGRYTVLPGLIDAHTHLLNLEHPKGNISTKGVKQITIEGLPLRALHGAARARTFLAAGISTTVPRPRQLRALRRRGAPAGHRRRKRRWAADDRVGPGMSPVGGQFPGLLPEWQSIAAEEYRIVHNADDAADAVRENVTLGARVIKIYSNDTPNPGSFSDAELAAIVEFAKRHGVRVAAHATSDEAVYRAARAGVNSSSSYAYRVASSTLSALMAKNGVMLVPTDLDTLSIEHYLRQGGTTPRNVSSSSSAR